ncbi:MAG: hypothetical protein D6782_01350, partial [Alphaproteobacteria bacterium]
MPARRMSVAIAVIFAGTARNDQPQAPRAGLKVAGLSVLTRQLRQAKRAGCHRAIIVTAPGGLDPRPFADHSRQAPAQILFATVEEAAGLLNGNAERCLVLADGAIVDAHLIDAVARAPEDSFIARPIGG